ncbi:MAG: RuvX/YqgF family protein [Candidatus Moraniibacteriota bacterium]
MQDNINKTEYILGIDYGDAKIGLAIADSETRMAFSYGTLSNDKDLLHDILDIIKKEKIKTVVIGIPKRLKDKKNEYVSQELGDEIIKSGKALVEYQDEIYSTKIARENLKEKGMKNISQFDHEESARIILDSFLQKKAL